ncbi:bifunctional folylpolyglutamate synthase/dihydrofolate synthase [Clostridium sp. NSJ-145]|uniref:bifunctional folylpolyglutamate synthase/dihydrofolate synthase n=1 Tax=Clostridium sp. NSJ-145 TaxID=2897777 RepID=UPI001E52A373|nr:folylpolyglutamate synthase/dihydrofolate synthase family protein [Clostridium sp. NSJ-145]MCD2500291.1 bifunctional folylpolyglutamate synthase/dihydrofolate synthase [Clostridium sp. NSJ-145]
MNYNEAMKYITEVGNFGSNYGLERTFRLLELLGNPQDNLKLIHVAGTNGKGSTTAMITKMLNGLGYKVGMYTSPFLEEFEERIQINGENIPKDVLAELVTYIKPYIDKVKEEGYGHPTEFEMITVLMLLYFEREKIDFGVVEVGLGGRLDSTNVIIPIVSVITSISFDHTNLLGNNLREIAGEKCGIIKRNIPTIVFPQQEEVMDVVIKKCEKENSKLYIVNFNDAELLDIVKGDKTFQKVKIKGEKEYILELPLLGEHQIYNLALAIKVMEVVEKQGFIHLNNKAIENSVREVMWKGRLEVLSNNPLIVIDGAHNIQGITTLKNNIQKYFNYKDVYLILGILADKDVEMMVKEITPLAKKVYAVTPHSIRAELAQDLRDEIIKYNENCKAYEDYEEAFNNALKDAKENDLIIASGSLYMIGDMRKLITRKYINKK